MASPISVNVRLSPSQAWSGRQTAGINTLLLINTDLNNSVLVGSDLQSLVVPIPPNGSLSVDPVENWYVTGLVAGTSPLVVVPNGQSTFRGLSQGAGKLALPQFQSPGFITGVSGWAVFQNGHAEFNDVVIRNGTVVSGLALYYDPAPGFGNLVASIAATSGVDSFGNSYVAGVASYGAGTAVSYLVQGRAVFNAADSTYITISSPGTLSIRSITESLFIQMPVRDIFALKPGFTAAEDDWQSPAPALINGWTNNASFGKFNYRKIASPPASIEFTGAIQGNAATSSTFFQIPAAYGTPVSAGGRPCGTNAGNGGATMVANVRWDTLGNLSINNSAAIPVAATFLFGFTLPMSAA